MIAKNFKKTAGHLLKGLLAALAILWLAGSLAQAQQRSTGGGGGGTGGGGGGTGGGGGNRGGGTGGGGYGAGGGGAAASSASSGNSYVDYPNNTLPGNATFSYDPETHSIIVRTDAETFPQISSVVSNLDRPKPQVLIKVVFLEVQHDNALDFGVEAQYNHNVSPSALGPTGNVGLSNLFGLAAQGANPSTIGQTTMPEGAGLYSVMGSDFQATVRAIASAEKVEVLSRPSIMVRNNQPATITVGQSVPLVTGISYPSTFGGPVSTITYQNIGIILQVTPFISNDGLVEMIVSPQISSLSSQTVQIATNLSVPVIDLRSASTVVVTPDGQTAIIGGLMENDKTVIDSKIPFLGDIPLLGNLFKHKQKADTKKELLIFLTPHVVNMPGQNAALAAHEEKTGGELSHKDFGEEQLDKFFDRLPEKPHSVWEIPGASTNTYR